MPVYYCTDAQLTDVLPTLTNTDIASSSDRDTKLRGPAKAWVDSVYPSESPLPGVSAASGYLINQAAHESGDETVAIDGGSGTPAAGDYFRVEGHNAWYKIVTGSTTSLTYTFVDSYRPGVERTTAGARARFLDDSPVYFGTPELVQQAAAWYGRGLAFQILRGSPSADEAVAAFDQARNLLQIGDDGLARAQIFPYDPDAWDADYSDDPPSAGYVNLVRA